MKLKSLLLAAAVMLGVAVAPARAFLITSAAELPGAMVQTFADAASYDTSMARVQIGSSLGINLGVTGINGPLQFGAPFGAWSLGSNGEWTSAINFVGIDAAGDTEGGIYPSMMFDFGSQRVQSFGAFMNFDPDFTFGGGFPLPLYIAAYDEGGTLLESYELPVFTPGGINAGSFYGITLGSALISRFEVSGPYAVLNELTFSAPVPEPSAYALLIAGLLALGYAVRRRRES